VIVVLKCGPENGTSPETEDTMTKTTRRGMMGALAASGVTLAASRAVAAPETLDLSKLTKDTDIACAYHCDFGDPRRFSQMLTNINNHLSVYEFDTLKVRIAIVAHGAGLKFFLADRSGTPWEKETIDPDLYKRVVGLSKFGVEVFLCKITYQRQKIDMAKTRTDKFLKFVPSGVASVAELQAKGWSYIKVG
jgi:intracellular sulfur oxidation DsrE/DsrF family protein